MSEKYIIIKKGNIQINLYVDTDLDDVILNRQELYKVLRRQVSKLKKPQPCLRMKVLSPRQNYQWRL